MKGTFKVQLFDKSGSVVMEQEKHNMMTNAIAKMMTPIALTNSTFGSGIISAGSNFQEKAREEFVKWFGSMVLMKNPVDNNPDNFLPDGINTSVGIGCFEMANSDSDPIHGSFNGTESGWNDKGDEYTFVYDFTTSQGNGQISSIGLMPVTAGVSGIGATFKNQAFSFSQKYSISSFYEYAVWLFQSTTNNNYVLRPLFVDYENDSYFGWDSLQGKQSDVKYFGKTGKIDICKVKVPLKHKFFNRDIRWKSINSSTSGVIPTVPVASMTLKNALSTTSTNYGFVHYAKGKIFACIRNSANWTSGTEVIMTVMDTETWTESFVTIRNNTGKTIKFLACSSTGSSGNYISQYYSRPCFCNGDYLLCRDLDGLWYSINLNNQAEVKLIKYFSDENFVANYDYMRVFHHWGDCVLFKYATSGNGAWDDDWTYLINLATGRIQHIGGKPKDIYSYSNTMMFPIKNIDFASAVSYESTGTQMFLFQIINPAFMFLTTKANLDSPVVKTADFTMKVRYTLKFDDPTE